MSRRRVQSISIALVIVHLLAAGVFAQESRDNPARPPGEERSWSLMSYAPMTATLRELAAKRRPSTTPASAISPAGISRTEIAYQVLKLAARSTSAATLALTERANRLTAAMIAYQHPENGYTFTRPRDWRENFAGAETLREEEILSGEIFISPDSEAFLSSAYRRFQGGFDGAVPVNIITPEVLIDKLLRKLRKLPGVNEARETDRRVSVQKGLERSEVGIEVSFRPTVNDAPTPFIGRAVILRDSLGVFELIGLRQQLSPPTTAKMIELALNSAKIDGQ